MPKLKATIDTVDIDKLHLVEDENYMNGWVIISESGTPLPASLYEVCLWIKYLRVKEQLDMMIAAMEKTK